MVSAYTQVGFDLDAGDRVLIETEPGVSIDGSLAVRVYPADVDVVRASAGSITFNGNREYSRRGEIIKIENNSSGTPKYPFSSLSIQSAILFDQSGTPINPSIRYSVDTQTVNVFDAVTGARIAVIGGVVVDYVARYARYVYQPILESPAGGRGVVLRYGSIIAIKGKAVAVLDLDAGFAAESNEYVEMYRVYTEIVADPDGAWEKPPNFPKDNSYPNLGGDGPDKSQYFIDQRIHEIGYIRRDGRSKYDTHASHASRSIWLEQPYQGTSNYTPPYKLIRRGGQGSAPEGFEEAFAKIKWGEIEAALVDRFPGLS